MLHKIIVCCLVVVALAFPARASSLWHPEPGFLPEDARHAVPNNPAPPERTVPEQVLPPLPVQDEGTIRRVATKEKVAALTFDLCELSTMTTGYDAEIIDFLREKRIPATLFMGGKWMRSHSERAMQLMADPLFEIGNHGWSHGNFGIMSEKAMLEQIRWTQAEYELLREEILKKGSGGRAQRRAAGSRNVVPLALRQMYGQGACTACARGPAGDPVERGCGNAAGQRGPRYGCAGGRAGAARRDYPVPCQPGAQGIGVHAQGNRWRAPAERVSFRDRRRTAQARGTAAHAGRLLQQTRRQPEP